MKVSETTFAAGASIPFALQLSDAYGNVVPEITNGETVVVSIQQRVNTNIARSTSPDSSSLSLAFGSADDNAEVELGSSLALASFAEDSTDGYLATWARSLPQAGVYEVTLTLDSFSVLRVCFLEDWCSVALCERRAIHC